MVATNNSKFTFLTYDSPHHSLFHRRAVKSHITSKYRVTRHKKKVSASALPDRYVHNFPLATSPHEDDEELETTSGKPTKPRQDIEVDSTVCLAGGPPSPIEINFTGTRQDPFACFPGQYTPCVGGAMDFFMQVLSPLHEVLEHTLNITNALTAWVFPLFLSSSCAFHSGVAMSQAYVEKCRSPDQQPSKEVDFHRWRAVSILREELRQLTGPPTDAQIMTVMSLACLDLIYKEPRTINRTGLGLMVARRGGLNNLGRRGVVKSFLVLINYFWLLEAGGGDTIFPLSRRMELRKYPEHPYSPEICSLIYGLPCGFHAIACQETLGLDVLQFLSLVRKYLESKENRHLVVPEIATADNDRDFPDIFDVCSCLQFPASKKDNLEKNLCLALVIFSYGAHDPRNESLRGIPFRGSRQELTRSLPGTQHYNSNERNCLIWIWMLAISSWRFRGSLEQVGLDLSKCFFDRFEEASSWKTVESIMKQFFWFDRLAKSWETCWQQAYDDWRSPGSSSILKYVTGLTETDDGDEKFLPTQFRYSSIFADTSSTERLRMVNDIAASNVSLDNFVSSRPEPQARSECPDTQGLPPMMTFERFLGQFH